MVVEWQVISPHTQHRKDTLSRDYIRKIKSIMYMTHVRSNETRTMYKTISLAIIAL